jgi:diaminopropionate ammonia-lyase
MLTETDQQLAEIGDGVKANVFVVAVGVGSWAHAVVAHYKGIDPTNRILAVEPDVAASLKESLHVGALTPIETGDTIMAGMNCGTTSKIAWPILRDGISAAITVTDRESHESVEYLRDQGISAGPCGAATLAALKKYIAVLPKEEREQLVVVLFSTEGWREYEIPA